MIQHETQLEPVLDWLRGCKNQAVRIEKRELADIDVACLHLREVEVSGQPASMYDDYIAQEELVLHGEGSLSGGAALPGDRFEIPLTGSWRSTCQEEALRLQTGRADYVITKEASGTFSV